MRLPRSLTAGIVTWSLCLCSHLVAGDMPNAMHQPWQQAVPAAGKFKELKTIPAQSMVRREIAAQAASAPYDVVQPPEIMAMAAPSMAEVVEIPLWSDTFGAANGTANAVVPVLRSEVANIRIKQKDEGAERWLKNPVAFHAEDYSLSKLLAEFAAKQGVGAKVSERLTGSVTGDIIFSDPKEFLELIGRTHLLNWYFDGVSAYFYPIDEMHSRLLPLDNVNDEQLRNTMKKLGLFDERFEWLVTDDGNLLKVQGPDMYLDQISSILDREKATIQEKKESVLAERKEKKLQVIRLDYAWADERTIATSNSSITVPGVADLLQQILNEQPGAGRSPAMQVPLGTSTLHKGSGLIGRRRAAAMPPPLPEVGVGPIDQERAQEKTTALVRADPRLNAVLIWDMEENHARNEQIVRELDQPLAMVEIRAAIVEVEADRTRELGISFEGKDGSGNWTNSGGINSASGDNYTSVKGDGLNFTTIYSHGLDNLMVRVRAMEKQGAANVLSRPSVLTQDNIQATLEQTETYYVKLEGYEEVDLADISTGLTMRVTPHIINNGEGGIQMSVYLTTGSDTGSGAESDYVPRVKQSTITTQAVVHEGEALVIGGYYNELFTKDESGVPFLRKLPVVGALFRNRSKLHTKVEKLFVLSPRVVLPGNSIMSCGSKAEYIMEHSPEREALNLPMDKDKDDWRQKKYKKSKTLSMDMD